MRGGRNTTISGPSSSCQLKAIQMAFPWHADDGLFLSFVIFQGIWTRIAKNPYIFCDFSGGRGGGGRVQIPCPSTLDPHMQCQYFLDPVSRLVCKAL